VTALPVELPVGALGPEAEPQPSYALFAATRQAAAVRCGLGVVAGLGALVLPWIGLNLSPDLLARHLTFSLGAVPLLGHLSYALVIVVLLVATVVSLVRSRGRVTPVTRAVGWCELALALLFVATTRIDGASVMFALTNDTNQTQIINAQFLTNNSNAVPTQFVGIAFDAKTLMLLYALRAGWYLLFASGVLLAGRLPRPTGRRQWTWAGLAGLAAAVAVVGLALGATAQSDMDNGIQAVSDGQPARGQGLLHSAERLDPQMAYDSPLEQALGQAQADAGLTTGLADYDEAVRPTGSNRNLLLQAQLFGQAIATLPAGSPQAAVVDADAAAFLANATVAVRNPDVLTLVTGALRTPAVTFSVGRYYYEAGAEPLAIRTLGRTMAETTNSEVRSLALTYIALAWQRLGHEATFRRDIVAAVKDDGLNENVYAREISTGLYVPGTP
jgi:hypothetical protein